MRQGATEHRNGRRTVVLFLLASIGLLVAGPKFQPVVSVLSPVFVPVETVVSGITDDATGFVSELTNLPQLQSENKLLRHQNAILIKQDAMYPVVTRENAAFSRELNFRDLNPHLVLQLGRVIGESTAGLNRTVTIDVGSNEGVRADNPVVDPNGFVVGKVTQVLQAQSTVGLLTAGNISIPAMDSRTGATGLVDTPYGRGPRLDDVLTGKRMRVGDLVVTSGLGNEFPIGSYIGQISHLQTSNVLPFQEAPIHTAADLNNLEYVQVIVNFGPSRGVNYSKSVAIGLKSK